MLQFLDEWGEALLDSRSAGGSAAGREEIYAAATTVARSTRIAIPWKMRRGFIVFLLCVRSSSGRIEKSAASELLLVDE